MWGMGGGHPYWTLKFESHLRTVVSENFVSNVAQATFYTKIVEFLFYVLSLFYSDYLR